MPRARASSSLPAEFALWASQIGEALGQGIARGINAGLAGVQLGAGGAPKRGPGRPPKALLGSGAIPTEKRCKVDGCPNAARSKGLCSKHYQAARRGKLQS